MPASKLWWTYRVNEGDPIVQGQLTYDFHDTLTTFDRSAGRRTTFWHANLTSGSQDELLTGLFFDTAVEEYSEGNIGVAFERTDRYVILSGENGHGADGKTGSTAMPENAPAGWLELNSTDPPASWSSVTRWNSVITRPNRTIEQEVFTRDEWTIVDRLPSLEVSAGEFFDIVVAEWQRWTSADGHSFSENPVFHNRYYAAYGIGFIRYEPADDEPTGTDITISRAVLELADTNLAQPDGAFPE